MNTGILSIILFYQCKLGFNLFREFSTYFIYNFLHEKLIESLHLSDELEKIRLPEVRESLKKSAKASEISPVLLFFCHCIPYSEEVWIHSFESPGDLYSLIKVDLNHRGYVCWTL